MRSRSLALLAVALLAVTAGCAPFAGVDEYELTATDVTGDVAGHATADLDRYEQAVAHRAAREGAAETVGWRVSRDPTLVAANGSYYRLVPERNGSREVTVPHLAVVETNASADVVREELPAVDRRALEFANDLRRLRAEENGTVREPRFAYPYHVGANDSELLGADGTVVAAFDRTLRVVVLEGTRDAAVYEYRAELVAADAATLEAQLVRDVSLTAAEREVLEEARADGYRVPVEDVEESEATAFAGLMEKAGIETPGRPGDTTDGYVRHEDRVLYLEIEYWPGGH